MQSFLDLTHAINSSVPIWDDGCGFHLQSKGDYEKQEFHVQRVEMPLGIGTHMDAPSHLVPQGKSIHEIPLSQLIVPGAFVDVSQKAHPDYLVSLNDLKSCGNIEGRLVIIHTGWDRFWNDTDKYRNCDAQGIMHFPTISSEAAHYLVEQKAVGIAIDTLSPDAPASEFVVHHLLLKNNIYIIENVANCSSLKSKKFDVLALPIKIEDASEAPIRLVAITH